MKSKTGFFLVLSCLFFFSACATFSSGCRTLMYSDTPNYYLKIFSHGKFVTSGDSLKEAFQPIGAEKMTSPQQEVSIGGPLYPFDFVANQPQRCGRKITQNVQLAFRGNIVFNGPFETETGKWKVLYRDPSQDLQIMIKVVGKK